MSASEVFRRIAAALDQAGIAYMLTGSFACAYYGTPRATQDIDFVIAATPEQLRIFVKLLPPHEYYVDLEAALEAQRRLSMFNVVDMAIGWKIDLIICKSRAFSEEEFRRRRRVQLQEIPLFVASAEDVVIAKLEWAKLAQSRRHIEDVAGILRLVGCNWIAATWSGGFLSWDLRRNGEMPVMQPGFMNDTGSRGCSRC